jgi:hypothetical protein
MNPKWSKFSLIDCVVLVAAFALGMGFYANVVRLPDESFESAIAGGIWGIAFGGVIAGPLIVLTQALRGRRSKLRSGEWHWLVPLGLVAFPFTPLVSRNPEGLYLVLTGIPFQGLHLLVAIVLIFAGFSRREPTVRYTWTDRFGYVVCALSGLPIVFASFFSMSYRNLFAIQARGDSSGRFV